MHPKCKRSIAVTKIRAHRSQPQAWEHQKACRYLKALKEFVTAVMVMKIRCKCAYQYLLAVFLSCSKTTLPDFQVAPVGLATWQLSSVRKDKCITETSLLLKGEKRGDGTTRQRDTTTNEGQGARAQTSDHRQTRRGKTKTAENQQQPRQDTTKNRKQTSCDYSPIACSFARDAMPLHKLEC
jgi:hypothetical protein